MKDRAHFTYHLSSRRKSWITHRHYHRKYFILAALLSFFTPLLLCTAAHGNEPPRCITWSGIHILGQTQSFPGAVWIKDDEGDPVQIFTHVSCVIEGGEGPMVWPYEDGDIGYPMADQYIHWDPPACGTCYILLTAYQVDDPAQWCEGSFILYRPCPDDPPTCVPDDCNICNGDGSSCAGENPVPSPTPEPGDENPGSGENPETPCKGQVDECGVCEGDGSACACSEEDTSGYSLDFDSRSLQMLKHMKGALKRSKKLSCIASKVRKKLLKKAEETYLSAWLYSNSIPNVTFECGSLVQCVELDLLGLHGYIRSHAKKFVRLVRTVRRKCNLNDKKLKARERYMKRLQKETLHNLKSLPTSANICKID